VTHIWWQRKRNWYYAKPFSSFVKQTELSVMTFVSTGYLFHALPSPPPAGLGAASVLRIHLIYITAAFSIQAIDLFSAPPPFPANQNKTIITNLPSHWTDKYAFLRVFIFSSVENEEPWNLNLIFASRLFSLFHYLSPVYS
jgi:hypothetical protein